MKQSAQLKAALERFGKGESHDAYQFMGCHPEVRRGQAGYVFRVYCLLVEIVFLYIKGIL